MNSFSKNFNSFRAAFKQEKGESYIDFLDFCFEEDPRQTLFELYKSKLLFTQNFIGKIASSSKVPAYYKLLFQIIQQNDEDIISASAFLRKFSQKQLLQGVANLLEKSNAELKYNANWNIKYAGGDPRYLETERQGTYLTSAGIEFQELLSRFYHQASTNDIIEVNWGENTENAFALLLTHLRVYNTIKDSIERHLYFDWSLEIIDDKTLKTTAPINQRESKIETDIINSIKSKIGIELSYELAQKSLVAEYLDRIRNAKPKPAEFWKYQPDSNNEEEMKWYAEAFMINVNAALKVKSELTVLKEHFFPGISELTHLELRHTENGLNEIYKLSLEDTFEVLSFLSEFSKKHIEQIDKQYTDGVTRFSELYPPSADAQIIETTTKLFKGNREAIKETLDKHYNDKVSEDQGKIISGAKNTITNENCLIQINYEKLIKTIQWLHQYDEKFIRKVIEIFTYTPETEVTRSPFFRLGNDLYWMPNLVAFQCFAESLIENLIKNKLVVIHKFQTNYFEKSLNNLFKGYGYKVVIDDRNKIYRSPEGKELGDFDVLAFKNGILIHMQLKLTNIRNNYLDRWRWKKNQLKEAVEQIESGNKYILENPNKICEILGLDNYDEIKEHHSFIISNGLLYDHEKIGGYLKISHFEAMLALTVVEQSWPGDHRNAKRYVELLNDNGLFKEIEGTPVVIDDMTLKIGEFGIRGPGLLQKNVYTAL